MAKVHVAQIGEAPLSPFPDLAGLTAHGPVESRGVYTSPDRPLWLWMHVLQPGTQLRWQSPDVGHVVYVWSGSVISDGQTLEAESVICIEHAAQAVLEGGDGGAMLIHFHAQEALSQPPTKPGGHVHRVGRDGLVKIRNEEYDVTTTFWLDSRCPHCDLWLHQSKIVTPRPQSLPHFHTEDEIIVVVQGGLILGRRILKAGAALAVDANTVYSFGVDEGGLAFINFRPVDPYFVMMSRDGPKHEPISEREHMSLGSVVSQVG